eukprot:gene6105-11830_t
MLTAAPSNGGMPLAETSSTPKMHFEPPASTVTIGRHYFWANGVMGMEGGKQALGEAEGSNFYTTTDYGASWSLTALNVPSGGAAPSTEATILSKDGITLHGFGNVANTPNSSAAYSSFNSSKADFYSCNGNGTFVVETRDTLITFKGLPQPAKNFRTDGRGYVRFPSDGSLVMSVILEWGVVAYKSVDGGYAWNYLSTILLGTDVPHSEEGPNENDLALMADGSIICIIRLDGGDGRPDHYMLPYTKVVSKDGGQTWSKATSMTDTRGQMMGCARPRLLGLTGGGVVLSGGRLNKTNHENYLWVNAAGDGADWEAISISYVHNMLEKNATLKFGPSVNNSGARISTSYTSLVATGAHSGYVVYSRLLPSPSVAFALRFALD